MNLSRLKFETNQKEKKREEKRKAIEDAQNFTPSINEESKKMAEKVRGKEKKIISQIDWLRRPVFLESPKEK